MKPNLVIALALVSGALVAGTPLFAHHGTGVSYVPDKVVTLKGVVTEWIWSNPHCGILFDVTDEAGNVVHWGAELGNPHALSGAGFSAEIMKQGDKITISGHPSKFGAPRIDFVSLILSDGRVITTKALKGNGEHAYADQ